MNKEGRLQDLDLRKGDVVECVRSESDLFTRGKTYKIDRELEVKTDKGSYTKQQTSTFRKVGSEPESIRLREVKIDVSDNTLKSAIFQTMVFDSGGSWHDKSLIIQNLTACHLYVDSDGDMFFGSNKDTFNKHTYQQIDFDLPDLSQIKIYKVESEKDKRLAGLERQLAEIQKEIDEVKGGE